METGIFDEEKYFDVLVEYAKADVEDVLIKITVANRGDEDAAINVLPTAWLRNTWTWTGEAPSCNLSAIGDNVINAAICDELGERFMYFDGSPELLFTENETNNERISGSPSRTPYVKDGIN